MLLRINSAGLATSLGSTQEVRHRPCLLFFFLIFIYLAVPGLRVLAVAHRILFTFEPPIYLLGSMVIPKKLAQAGRAQGFLLANNSCASHLIHPLSGPGSSLVWVGGMRKAKE